MSGYWHEQLTGTGTNELEYRVLLCYTHWTPCLAPVLVERVVKRRVGIKMAQMQLNNYEMPAITQGSC
jgi:hypothetical protein